MISISTPLHKKLTPEELHALLGPPPVLKSESADNFNEVLARFLDCLKAEDSLEQVFVNDVAVATWEAARWTRDKILAIERQFQRNEDAKARRATAAKDKEQRETNNEPEGAESSAWERITKLADLVDDTVCDVDGILDQTEKEMGYAVATQQVMIHIEQLDRLLNAALARRNSALDQLERYRCGQGRYWRQVSDRILAEERAALPQGLPAENLTPGAKAQRRVTRSNEYAAATKALNAGGGGELR